MTMIRLQYPNGRSCGSVSESHARAMIQARVAHAVGTGRQVRCIQLEDGPTRPVAGTKHVHRSKSAVNPAGTWTFNRIPDRASNLFGLREPTTCH